METFPIANSRYLFARRRQKISPPNPRGTGYADFEIAYPGVATRKTPERKTNNIDEYKNVH